MWTKTVTEPGLYWHRKNETAWPYIMRVFRSTFNPKQLYVGSYNTSHISHVPITSMDGEWQPVKRWEEL